MIFLYSTCFHRYTITFLQTNEISDTNYNKYILIIIAHTTHVIILLKLQMVANHNHKGNLNI